MCFPKRHITGAMKKSNKNKLVGSFAENLEANMLLNKKCFEQMPGSHARGSGIYVLLKGPKIHYIGLARKSLRWRIYTHLKDHLKGEWDHFSFYQIPNAKYVKDIETLFLRILQKTPGNKVGGKFRRRHNLGKVISALGAKIDGKSFDDTPLLR